MKNRLKGKVPISKSFTLYIINYLFWSDLLLSNQHSNSTLVINKLQLILDEYKPKLNLPNVL